MSSKKGKIRQAGGYGRPWRLNWVLPREPIYTFLWNINEFPFFVRQTPPRPGGAEGRNSGRSPEGARLARMPGRFPGGGWRAGRGRRRLGMTGSRGEPPGLRNEPNCQKQKLHQIVTSDRADRNRQGSTGSAGEWRDGKIEGRSAESGSGVLPGSWELGRSVHVR